MELNRTHYMMIGLVLLALGVQFRRVESFVLTEKATQVIAKRLKKTDTVATTFVPSLATSPPASKLSVPAVVHLDHWQQGSDRRQSDPARGRPGWGGHVGAAFQELVECC